MIWLLIPVGLIALFAAPFFCIPWVVHRDQTIDFSRVWGYGSRAQFEEQFNSIQWERERLYPESLFDRSTDSEIHASIIRFRDHGMVILPWHWLAVRRKLKRLRLKGASTYEPWGSPKRTAIVEPH
jgi:hypothetical protein